MNISGILKNCATLFLCLCTVCFGACTFSYAESRPACSSSSGDASKLEQCVAHILRSGSVEKRRRVDLIFKLAMLKAEGGYLEKAANFYREGLKVDGWNMEAALDFADVCISLNRFDEAYPYLAFVYERAENEYFITKAQVALKKIGGRIEKQEAAFPAFAADKKILLVPVGRPNPRVLAGLRKGLRNLLQVDVDVFGKTIRKSELGKFDRTEKRDQVFEYFRLAQDNLTPDDFNAVLKETGHTGSDLVDNEKAHLEIFLGSIDYMKAKCKDCFTAEDGSEITAEMFIRQLEELDKTGQYDAERILKLLKERIRPEQETARDVGIVGVTGEDMYADESHFLFGTADDNYAIVSYHRFTSEFNGGKQNRKLMMERILKQAASSSLFALGGRAVQFARVRTCLSSFFG